MNDPEQHLAELTTDRQTHLIAEHGATYRNPVPFRRRSRHERTIFFTQTVKISHGISRCMGTSLARRHWPRPPSVDKMSQSTPTVDLDYAKTDPTRIK